jgi:hypothetical protein
MNQQGRSTDTSVQTEIAGYASETHVSLENVHGSITVPHHLAGFWRQWRAFVGPAILVSVGYMDPGNWGTDLQGGAQFKYGLLWVVGLASLMGRVEMWRGSLGLTYLFPALSSAGASLVGPCSVSTSRSSNRMCGFPASGSRRKFTILPTRSGRYVSQALLSRRSHTGIYPGTFRYRVALPCVCDTATNAAVCGRVDRSPDRPC